MPIKLQLAPRIFRPSYGPKFMLVVYAGNAARAAAVQLIFVCSQNEQNLAKAVI